ncbi:hypothetical protein [Candidatus Pantoea persica]|uniref:hypothetical protein n=1 Tax=Candidatus Pantoea persica TaxID=2518128 RepID=UPI00215D5E3C|nr:hypothetical protein [Candidatus Pantoea persica]MBA2817365.1 MFS transporter [Candidatus Pantoea persica]
MSAINSVAARPAESPPAPLVFTLAAGAGLSVASIYYSQPMLDIISKAFLVGAGAVGMVPMLMQAGYALGILLLAPRGDRHDRRTIILIKGLLLCGFSGGLSALLIASFVTGLTATVAQDIVPASVALAQEQLSVGFSAFWSTLALIVLSTVGFDLGVQVTLVAHQTLVYSQAPEARSRLNALLFTVVFIGMATGAALGSMALARWGRNGVVTLATLAGAASLALRLASRHLKNCSRFRSLVPSLVY